MKAAALLYGVVCYLLFLVVFVYAIAFVGGIVVPKAIDSGEPGPLAEAMTVNLILLGLFGAQHSIMARQGFKRWWTRLVPAAIERSTFVLFASLVLALLMWQWRPMPETVWHVEGAAGRAVLWALFALGFGGVLLTTYLIDHFHLFGLLQVARHYKGLEQRHPQFQTPLFYRFVRHPLYLGFIVAFWSAPTMSQGHLLFAVVTTAYILVAIQLEERDLVAFHGPRYEAYKEQVPMLVPMPGRHAATPAAATKPSSP